MEHGKKICKALKNIRSLVAQANDIPLQIEECTYEGHCTGTCPKCESEARFLEEALQQRRDQGLPIRVEHLMSEEHLRQIVESSSDENNFDNDDFVPLEGMPMPLEGEWDWENEQDEETDDDIHVLEGNIAPLEGELMPPEEWDWENEQDEETDDDIHVLEGDIAPLQGMLMPPEECGWENKQDEETDDDIHVL